MTRVASIFIIRLIILAGLRVQAFCALELSSRTHDDENTRNLDETGDEADDDLRIVGNLPPTPKVGG